MEPKMSPRKFFEALVAAGTKEAVIETFEKNIEALFNDGSEEQVSEFKEKGYNMDDFRVMAVSMYRDIYNETDGKIALTYPEFETIMGWLEEYVKTILDRIEKDDTRFTTKKMAKKMIGSQSKEEALFEFESVIGEIYGRRTQKPESAHPLMEDIKKSGMTLNQFLLHSAMAVQDLLQHYAASKELPEEECKRAFYYFYGYDPEKRKGLSSVN